MSSPSLNFYIKVKIYWIYWFSKQKINHKFQKHNKKSNNLLNNFVQQ